MTHELAEADAVARGMSQDEAHEVGFATHTLYQNYDADVITQFPELFNSDWQKDAQGR